MEKYCVEKKLAEEMKALGFKHDHIWVWIWNAVKQSFILKLDKEVKNIGKTNLLYGASAFFPAYTVGELGEMLPAKIYSFHVMPIDKWRCIYSGMKFKDLIIEDTEANARAKMLIYLKEEGLI